MPNITGTLFAQRSFIRESFYHSGAISAWEEYNGDNGLYAHGWESCAGRYNSTMQINASRSNSAYGKRNEVAPANYTMRIWKRIS